MEPTKLTNGLTWFVAFLFSTTVHEAMHALVALKSGDATAQRGGQVSLSPIPHIMREPIGMLIVPLLTAFTMGWAIGWASTPYDPLWASRHPRRAALMAAAGPIGNLLLALIAFAALKIGLAAGWFGYPEREMLGFNHLVGAQEGSGSALAGGILSVFLMLNVLLFVFNLLPIPPLDGASAVGIFLPESLAKRVRTLVSNPAFSLFGLLIAWRVFPYIAGPLFLFVFTALHG